MWTRRSLLLAVTLPPGPHIRVRLFGLFRPTHLLLTAGPAGLRLDQGRLEPGARLQVALAGSGLSCNGERINSLHTPGGRFRLAIPDRIEREYEGELLVAPAGSVLAVELRLPLEPAVAAVVGAEGAVLRSAAAREALAIAARSYYRAANRHADGTFCDTSHCQWHKTPPPPGHPGAQAALATAGLALRSANGWAAGYFSAACGGRTVPPAAIGWPGDRWLTAVDCPPCVATAGWTTELPAEWAPHFRRHAGEDNLRLAIGRRFGWQRVPSNVYHWSHHGSLVRLEGRGTGHNVGLCLHGADAMGLQGAGNRAILRHYFPALTVSGWGT